MKLVTNIIGYVGGSILAIQNVPLVLRIWNRRSTGDLSYHTLAYFIIGGTMTIVYGVLINAPPIYATLAFSLMTNVVILVMKVIFDKTRQDEELLRRRHAQLGEGF